MPKNPERSHELQRYAQEQVKKFRAREIAVLPSNGELMEKFGYSKSFLSTVLSRTDLISERRTARQIKQEAPVIIPSRDWGWMLGFIAGRCSNDLVTGTITLQSNQEDPSFEIFRQAGEGLFKLETIERAYILQNRGKNYDTRLMQFTNTPISQAIGDMVRGHWADTVESKHQWLLEEGRYTWAFITGFFDARGSVNTYEAKNPPAHSVVLSSSSFRDANVLVSLLTGVGLQNPTYLRRNNPKDSREGVKGIILGNLKDIRFFADNIHSRIAEKEAKLQYYRDLDIQPQTGRSTMYSDQEIIREWQRLTDLLGHIPTSREIKLLRKENQSLCAPIVYGERFGNGSFSQARENIQKIISQSGEHTDPLSQGIERPQRQRANRESSADDVVQEWRYLRAELGHSPSARDISLLKKQGKTRYSFGVYSRRFGEGHFHQARERLEAIKE